MTPNCKKRLIPELGHVNTLHATAKQVYDEILEDLITWDVAPGEILLESRLAERFQTSRTPVREALKVLAGEGFLKIIPRTGYVVRSVTVDDVHEVSFMRQLLEPEAAALTTSRLSMESVGKSLDELQSYTQELERRISASDQIVEPREVYNYNTWFHLCIAHASGVRRLVTAIRALLKEEERVMFRDTTVKDAAFVTSQHLALLKIIRSGDVEQAKIAMKEHVLGNRARLLESLVYSGSSHVAVANDRTVSYK